MFRARIKPKYKRCSDHRGGEMKLNTVDSITDALRERSRLITNRTARARSWVAQQLFGVTAAKLLLSSLDEVASNVRSRGK